MGCEVSLSIGKRTRARARDEIVHGLLCERTRACVPPGPRDMDAGTQPSRARGR
jgi:hypothetical protein